MSPSETPGDGGGGGTALPYVDPHSLAWEAGVYDAHCHPTDTMSTVCVLASMRAAALTIMATRFEDQSLVAELARTHACGPGRVLVESRAKARRSGAAVVVPSFGYHPWFSHLLWDDADAELRRLDGGERLKRTHYARVLTPEPTADFVDRLPDPRPLSVVLDEVRARLREFPAALVGEIGMDRAFRLPRTPDANGRREDSRLSPHRVAMEHQKRVFKAQLEVAGEFGRAVSVHGVQCHGAVFDVFRELWAGHEVAVESRRELKLRRRRVKGSQEGGYEHLPDVDESSEESSDDEEEEEGSPPSRPLAPPPGLQAQAKPYPPRICLHSFSAGVQTLQQWLARPTPHSRYPSDIFFSFSTTINARPGKGHLEKIRETIKHAPDRSVLVESDLHTATDIDEALAQAVGLVAAVKEWTLDGCVHTLADNWTRFVFG